MIRKIECTSIIGFAVQRTSTATPAFPRCGTTSTDYDIPAFIRRGIRIAGLDHFAATAIDSSRSPSCGGPGGLLAQQRPADTKADAGKQQPDQGGHVGSPLAKKLEQR